MTACQVRLKTDDRLGVLIPCNRPDAGLARIVCPRMGHTEIAVMCNKCLYAVVYCEQCLAQDQLLVRSRVLALV
jgi:hypothetical protein